MDRHVAEDRIDGEQDDAHAEPEIAAIDDELQQQFTATASGAGRSFWRSFSMRARVERRGGFEQEPWNGDLKPSAPDRKHQQNGRWRRGSERRGRLPDSPSSPIDCRARCSPERHEFAAFAHRKARGDEQRKVMNSAIALLIMPRQRRPRRGDVLVRSKSNSVLACQHMPSPTSGVIGCHFEARKIAYGVDAPYCTMDMSMRFARGAAHLSHRHGRFHDGAVGPR